MTTAGILWNLGYDRNESDENILEGLQKYDVNCYKCISQLSKNKIIECLSEIKYHISRFDECKP